MTQEISNEITAYPVPAMIPMILSIFGVALLAAYWAHVKGE